jgi:hypothetical protein
MNGIPAKIMKLVQRHGRGRRVYTPKAFLDFGSRAAVDQALSRLVKDGRLRRVGRGLYDYPRQSKLLGQPVPPRADAVAAAVAGRNANVLPDGMAAANALRLTNAISAKPSFVTDGRTKDVVVGSRTVRIKAPSRHLKFWMGHPAAHVVQALLWLGRSKASDPDVVTTLRSVLPDDVKNDLRNGVGDVPGWAEPIVRQVVAQEGVPA